MEEFDPGDMLDEDEAPQFDVAAFQQSSAFQKTVHDNAIRELSRIKGQEQAKKWFVGETPFDIPVPKTLKERLLEQTPEEHCFIQDIMPDDANMYIAAQAGSGKTTFVHNLLRSAVDGVPFLDNYTMRPTSGNVVLIDLEMNQELTNLWLSDQEIINQDKLFAWNFRGEPLKFDITNPQIFAQWSAVLRSLDAEVIVLDCLTPLITALQLDENRDLRKLLYAFYNLVKDCGARQGIAVHHAGWNGRSRGDSAAVGIADVNILLDENHTMEITKSRLRNTPPKQKLQYDHQTRHLSVSDVEQVEGIKLTRDMVLETDVKNIVEFMKADPSHQNISKNTLEQLMSKTIPQKRFRNALTHAMVISKQIINAGTDARPKLQVWEFGE